MAEKPPSNGAPQQVPPPAYEQAWPPQQRIVMVQTAPQDIPDRIVHSVINLVCCSPPLGIAALIFAVQAESDKRVGDLLSAQHKSETAKILNLVGFVIGAVFWTIMACYLIFVLIMFISLASTKEVYYGDADIAYSSEDKFNSSIVNNHTIPMHQ